MATKRELARAEDAGWAELIGLVEPLTTTQAEEPGYFEEGWSVKDLMAHIGSWLAEAGLMLEQIRWGTYQPRNLDVDAMNQQFYEANKDLPWPLVRAECWSGRTRMLVECNKLEELTSEAESWFVESGPQHYDEHLPRLREWVGHLLHV